MAETKSYLQMEPLIGDSKNPRYKKAVELESWSFGNSLNGGGASVSLKNDDGEKDFFIILPPGSKADIKFRAAMLRAESSFRGVQPGFETADQTVFREAVLTIEKLAGGKALKKYTIMKMSPVIVVSVERGDNVGTAVEPLTQVWLRFKKLQYIIPD